MEYRQELQQSLPLLLRIPDIERESQVKKTKIYAEIAAGRLRTIHIGRAVRVRRDDFLEWIEQLSA